MRHFPVIALFVVSSFPFGCSDDAGSRPGDEGPTIEVPDACESAVCGDHEACVEADGHVASCVCVEGFERDGGGDCVAPVEATCDDVECGAHGTCEVVDGAVSCECQEGFAGAECDVCDAGGGFEPDGQGGCSPEQGDPCDPNPCLDSMRTVCVVEDGAMSCKCDPGSHDEDGHCLEDTVCLEDTCNGHGGCSVAVNEVACDCQAGYEGAFCEICAAEEGYLPDGFGGCTLTPCAPNPCNEPGRGTCLAGAAGPICDCDAGRHDVLGECVDDVVCQENTCNGRGSCDDTDAQLTCACDPGFAGRFCDQCDTDSGFHEDGTGGCTDDPCTPNPCLEPNRARCTPPDAGHDVPVCSCDGGYHDDGGVCVEDQVCAADSCNDAGACHDDGGRIECLCDTGFAGLRCGSCDVDAGFHADGLGGCTTNPCVPNPCGDPNQGVCTANGDSPVCGCDVGFHADGVGGCTDAPCVPDPCRSLNQACRDDGAGEPECFTPVCNDDNPCTDDALVDGQCTYTDIDDGTGCSTTLCTANQACQGGHCVGGDAVVCDDHEPCTQNTCDPFVGCLYPTDDTLVPDDGFACTRDSCLDGGAVHTPSDAVCDDGAFCTGVETCAPGSADADTDGCIVRDVPAPPVGGAGPCASYRCDNAIRDFVLDTLAVGSGCNDGLSCTDGDVCTTDGACRGTPNGDCRFETCNADEVFDGNIDIPRATVSGTMTLGGAPLPDTNGDYDGGAFYLIARDTGAWHRLADYSYSYVSSGVYALRTATYEGQMIPGVYDVLFRRHWDRTYDTVDRTGINASQLNGLRILAEVVIGPGANVLDLDIPRATVSGTMTLGGAPLPDTNGDYDGGAFYLVAADTGAWHRLADYSYSYVSSGVYALRSDTYEAQMIPGEYDLLFRRDWDSTYNTVGATGINASQLNGLRILAHVTIADGANVLDIDIPRATVSGTMTLGGAPLPDTNGDYTGGAFYLIAADTGAWHRLADYSYSYVSSGVYALRSDTYETQMIPGEYDLLFRRDWDSTYDTVGATGINASQLNGLRILAHVTIADGTNVLDVDIPRATVSGTMTLGGAPLPDTNGDYAGGAFYLVAADTGAWHRLADYSYSYVSSGVYSLRSDTYEAQMIPGEYDLLFRRNWDSTYNTVGATGINASQLNGLRILAHVTIADGTNVLDIDIPRATVSGTMTLGGAPLPATNGDYDGGAFYLVAADTGAWHRLADYSYSYVSSGVYALRSDTYEAQMIPGEYDLLFRRNWDSTYNTVGATGINASQLNGLRILAHVTIADGTNVLDIDIPRATVSGTMSLGGAPLPDTNGDYDGGSFYLIARDTGVWHRVADYSYSYVSSGVYALRSDTYGAQMIPGEYDLLFRRNWDSTYDTVGTTGINANQLNGLRILQPCLVVQ